MLRYECLSANVEFGQKWMPSYPGDNMVSMLPMAHMYGMMFEFIYVLCGGATVNFLGKTPTPHYCAACDGKDIQGGCSPYIGQACNESPYGDSWSGQDYIQEDTQDSS